MPEPISISLDMKKINQIERGSIKVKPRVHPTKVIDKKLESILKIELEKKEEKK